MKLNMPNTPPHSPEIRRVVIEIKVNGSHDDANAVRDAIGESITDEMLMPVVMGVVENRGIESAFWEVIGERWVATEENTSNDR